MESGDAYDPASHGNDSNIFMNRMPILLAYRIEWTDAEVSR
jgi:hypothetical protein